MSHYHFPTLAAIGLGALLSPAPSAAQSPVLYFSDLASGPATGNTDSSGGRVVGRDGVFVTVWGRNFGASPRVSCGGVEAASILSAGDARSPADLTGSHRMQMLVFQIAASARPGAGEITVTTGGLTSNPLPFTVRPGNIRFARTSGDDATGDGTWTRPWRTIPKAVASLAPGDVAYVGDGVDQTAVTDFDAAVVLGAPGEPGRPKALVAYPGARSRVGSTTTPRAFHSFDPERSEPPTHWTIAKFELTTREIGVTAETGFRVVGNFVTAPNGDGLDGAIGVLGSGVAVLGNELSGVGAPLCGKLYHAIYASGVRLDAAPRAPAEADREIGWNYIHDGRSNRAINVYSEQPNSAFISGHRIHDNVIVDQHGDGILLGYYVTGENWIVNNLIVRAGLGPEWPDDASSHAGIRIDAGHEASPGTVVHVLHNTLHGCGYPGAVFDGENGHLFVSAPALGRGVTVDFRNNIVSSTGESYVAPDSGAIPPGDYRNLWSGGGAAPAWDRLALSAPPGFTDAAGMNFELQAGSACVDAAGALSPPVSRDLFGTPRPQGPAPDLGAFERVTGGTADPCSLSCSAAVPATGRAGEALSFSLSVTPSSCPAGTPAVAWTFGDGASASGAATSHAYAASGTYGWTATATLAGATCTRSGSVAVTAVAPAPWVYVVPAVTHLPGAFGALFRTDVAVVNRGAAAASLTLTYVPSAGGSLARTATVPVRGTRDLADVLVGTFGFAEGDSTFGALTVGSDQPLVVSSRTYNQTAAGTLGGSLAGPASTAGLTPGRTGILPHLRRSAAFRTNVAVTNLGASSATVRIQLWDANGTAAGSPRFLTPPVGGMVQENDVFAASGAGDRAAAYATVDVETPGGRVWAFASVIDNA
ncbi:MAG: PKD domain-containing protein, partial [Acidobacteriota bacterium]